MKIDFDPMLFGGNECIHCSTKEEAISLMEFLDGIGVKWNSNEVLCAESARYSSYGRNTVYFPNTRSTNRMWYGSLEWARKNKYTVYEFCDINFGATIKPFDVGDFDILLGQESD